MPEPLDILGTIKQMSDDIEKSRAEVIDYIVIDPAVENATAIVREVDADKKLFIRIPPSMLDGVKFETVRYGPFTVQALTSPDLNAVIGIPIYKRENMREGWPY